MKLNTIDGAALMSQPLRPPDFVVDSLLSQGLHILAGSPKVGKSWLVLWLAVMVAKGEPVWDMATRQGHTLYLCLEDSVLRIQNRLFEITEDAPESVHFCTECAPIGQGLEEQIETFSMEHPGTVLVIIDTLQMVRPIHDATYANDYRDMSVLKRLADRLGLAILLIHHLRKEKAEDGEGGRRVPPYLRHHRYQRSGGFQLHPGGETAGQRPGEADVYRQGHRIPGAGTGAERRQCVGATLRQQDTARAAGGPDHGSSL